MFSSIIILCFLISLNHPLFSDIILCFSVFLNTSSSVSSVFLKAKMGNCLFLCIPSKRKILWVEKMDGKMIQFQGPILVKDVLANFSGLGVGVSRESLQNLPSDYELKSGKVYHLLPSSVSSGDSSSSVGATEVSSMADDGEKKTTTTTSGMTRIKVVITKQQLQELLSKKTSLEELLLSQSVFPSSPGNWKPKLDPIPEGIE